MDGLEPANPGTTIGDTEEAEDQNTCISDCWTWYGQEAGWLASQGTVEAELVETQLNPEVKSLVGGVDAGAGVGPVGVEGNIYKIKNIPKYSMYIEGGRSLLFMGINHAGITGASAFGTKLLL